MPSSTPRKFWTPEKEQQLRQLYPSTPMPELMRIFARPDRAIYSKARSLGVSRSAEYLASAHACRLRRGDTVGEQHRFKKGHATWNAGMKGWQAEGIQATQFKPGRRPHTWRPIGSERTSPDGYRQRKVSDTGYPPRDWIGLHCLLWREHHGDIPAGHIVVFRDRNKQHIDIDNLELISRAEHCRRNSIHNYPPELKDAMRALSKLKRTINRATEETP